jgi:tetratricopeptide (TPR) repeat protein
MTRGRMLVASAVGVAAFTVAAIQVARAEERASVIPNQPNEAKASLTTQSGRLLIGGDAKGALAKAEEAVKAEPKSGIAQYYKAEALSSLNQQEAAVTAYEQAVAQLPATEVQTRSQAVWGKGLALRALGRCDEAKQAFAEYVAAMQGRDKNAAAQADGLASACKSSATPAAK